MATPNKANEVARQNAQDAIKKKQMQQTERLVKAVLELEKRFKKQEAEEKKTGGKFTFRGFTKNAIKQGVARLRDVVSMKGVAGMMGVQQESFLGSMLEARHQSKLETKEISAQKAKDAQEHAKKWGELTQRGQQMKKNGFSQERIIAEGVKDYEKRLKIAERIKEIEEKIADAKKLGNADISAKEKKELEKLQEEQSNLGKAVTRKKKESTQEEPAVKPKRERSTKITKEEAEEIADVLISRGNVSENAITETQKNMGRDLDDKEKEELIKGIKAGMSDEILQLNKEQLKELRELVKNTKESTEDKLEKNRAKQALQQPETNGKGQSEEGEKKKSMMDRLSDAKDKLSDVGDLLKRNKGSIMKNGGKLLKGAGVLAAGVSVASGVSDLLEGKKQEEMPTGLDVVDPMKWGMYGGEKLNKGVEAVTGKSVGNNVYDGVQSVKKFFGFKSDDDKIKEMLKPTEARAKTVDSLEQKRKALEAKKEAKPAAAPVVTSNNVVNNTTKVNKLSIPVRNIEPSYNARLQSVMV